jgi:cytochrome c biogenesis protein CcdA
MSVVLRDTHPLMRKTSRLILLVVAVAVGFGSGFYWQPEISAGAYDGFVNLFAAPGIQITSMAMGIAVAYLVGVIHVTTICWLPGALATVPIVQDARSDQDRLKTVAVIALCMVVVTTLFGMLISAPASLFAGIAGSRRTMSTIMQPALVASGLVMVVLAMGELGLIRRLLPSLHHAPAPVAVPTGESTLVRYRRAAILAIWMTSTFGIFCTKPLYLGLLVYVAVIGSVAYGALALGAYGLGLATTLTLGGLVLMRASRAVRFKAWLAEREETFHLVQGVVFAALGAMTVAFF